MQAAGARAVGLSGKDGQSLQAGPHPRSEELGAEVVKIFPGSQVGGPSFVAAVKGPFPWTSIMPTGGVEPTEDNLKGWFNAGVHCVGMGSKLFVKNADGSFDYAGISAKVKEALNIVKKYKS